MEENGSNDLKDLKNGFKCNKLTLNVKNGLRMQETIQFKKMVSKGKGV
jgi:hypothetical protein